MPQVDEAPPFGLIITAMDGQGWSCLVQPTPTCTRTDVLVAGASYPPIVVTADITNNAISPLFNGATVTLSGQGESEYDNNFAIDRTTIVSSPIPTLGTWGLLLTILGVAGVAAGALRRKDRRETRG